MFDYRTNLSAQVRDEASKFFGELLFERVVPRSVRLSEAPSHGMAICNYAPGTAGAKAYHEIALELDQRCVESGFVQNADVKQEDEPQDDQEIIPQLVNG